MVEKVVVPSHLVALLAAAGSAAVAAVAAAAAQLVLRVRQVVPGVQPRKVHLEQMETDGF
jgi:hypothetical protein